MDWHPALERPTHQVNDPTLNSSGSTLLSSRPLDSISQPQAMGYWNRSYHLVIRPSCPRQLSPTSQVFVPCMLMLAYFKSLGRQLEVRVLALEVFNDEMNGKGKLLKEQVQNKEGGEIVESNLNNMVE